MPLFAVKGQGKIHNTYALGFGIIKDIARIGFGMVATMITDCQETQEKGGNMVRARLTISARF